MCKKIGMVIVMMGLNAFCAAQEFVRSGDVQEIDDFQRFKFGFDFDYGIGSEKITLAETEDETAVTISPGGGLGGEICFGVNIIPLLELDLGLAIHRSNCVEEENHALEDFFSSFTNYRIRFTPKINIPVSSKLRMNLGAGIDWCVSGQLDISLTKYFHNVFQYKNDIGLHLKGEIGLLVPGMKLAEKSYLVLGVAYNRITYRLDSFTSDGVSTPIDVLSEEELSIVERVNGNGLSLSLGFSFYF